ncbi:MAG: hypothetical protein ISS25_03000 [Nanoarchaeota archaeon]|nr:hypothetical protein [DPANN group archaeon]MBL7116768.1 hypothetical protein [Nanoarchaeota archaeon]
MLRVIFDTNIYGHLFKEPDALDLKKKITKDKDFVIYGYQPIRKELRDIPKISRLSKQTRVLLLSMYDELTGNHLLKNSTKINHLAKKYYDYYRKLGGNYGWDTSIRVDFMIVACASIKGLDVVYSADNKTLLSKSAVKSYNHINLKENYRTPNLLKYIDLLTKYRELD